MADPHADEEARPRAAPAKRHPEPENFSSDSKTVVRKSKRKRRARTKVVNLHDEDSDGSWYEYFGDFAPPEKEKKKITKKVQKKVKKREKKPTVNGNLIDDPGPENHSQNSKTKAKPRVGKAKVEKKPKSPLPKKATKRAAPSEPSKATKRAAPSNEPSKKATKRAAPSEQIAPNFVAEDWRAQEDWPEVVQLHAEQHVPTFIFEDLISDNEIQRAEPKANAQKSAVERSQGRESFRHRLQLVIERKNIMDLSDIEESEWGKRSRIMSLPGKKSDGQYVYPPVFTEHVCGEMVDLQQTAIVEFKETASSLCAEDIESRVFSAVYEHLRVQKFSRFLVRVDRTQRIDDQIAKCSPHIRTEAERLDTELKETLFQKQFLGLDKEHFTVYKHCMRDTTKALEKLVDELAKPSVYREGVSQDGPTNFSELTFLEKTVYTWHCFVEKFERLHNDFWNWGHLTLPSVHGNCVRFNVKTLSDFLRVPDFSHDMTGTEKNETRSKFYHLLEEPYGMELKEMIGMFCTCVRHYSNEDNWKKIHMRKVLQNKTPLLYKYWFTYAKGPWAETDIQHLIYSLDFKFSSKIRDDLCDFVRNQSHDLRIEKKKALNELFSQIIHDEMIVEKNSYNMRLKYVKEPVGRISIKACTGIDCSRCGRDTVKWGSGFQSRCGDEPMDEFLLCKSCGHFEKI